MSFLHYHTIANILCIRKPATGGLPGRRRSPLYAHMIRTRTHMCTVQSCCDAVAIEIPVKIDACGREYDDASREGRSFTEVSTCCILDARSS